MDGGVFGAWMGLIGTVVGAIIGGVASYWATQAANKAQAKLASEAAKSRLQDLLDQIVTTSLTYPYVETSVFFDNYPNIGPNTVPTDPYAKDRYENYCVLVFNTLSRIHEFFDGDHAKIMEFVHADELVGTHHKWWRHDVHNAYLDDKFKAFVNLRIDDLRKKGKIQ